jgi:hypothetical protein
MAGIIGSYRKKKSQRDAAREQQLAQLLAEVKRDPSVLSVGVGAVVPAKTATPLFKRKPRLLPQTHGLLYYVLRAGLPDHAIFPNQALGDFIEPGDGSGREQQRQRLATQRADFIICNKQLEVVAAVLVKGLGSDRPLLEPVLRSAGIRLVQIDAAKLPKHTQVRTLIYGADAPSTT